MAGRPRHYDIESLIDRATDVFWKKGYEASSAQDLLQAMDIGQGSFYLAFKGGKRELFEKALIQFSTKASKKFKLDIEAADDPIEFIKDFFRSLASSSEERKSKGCFLGNALIELSNVDPKLKKLSAKLLVQLENDFLQVIVNAQKEGRISNKTNPELLARHLINLWNGLNVTRRMHPTQQELLELIEMNLTLLN